MAHKPHETGLSELPEDPVTNVIAFTPSGHAPSDLPPGHSAEILHLDADGSDDGATDGAQANPH